MKPALYYAITHGLGHPVGDVVAVTSVKGTRHWYGRKLPDNLSTNGMMRDLRAKFSTEKSAVDFQAHLRAVMKQHDDNVKHAQKQMALAMTARNKALEKVWSNCNGIL